MELKYHIDSQVCNVVIDDEDLYIQGELRSSQKTDKITELDTVEMQLTLYNVSEPDDSKKPRQKGKKSESNFLRRSTRTANNTVKLFRPKTKITVEFSVSTLLFETLFSDGRYFSILMPMTASQDIWGSNNESEQTKKLIVTG